MISWNNTLVVVTGAGGFIGSHLVEKLVGLGARVTAFVRYNSRNDPGVLYLNGGGKKPNVPVIAGDIRDLLLQFGYPSPVLQCSAGQSLGQMNLWMIKDTPGLDYFLQLRTNFVQSVWRDLPVPTVEGNTIWSSELHLQPETESGFYRMRVTPSAGLSPPWPL